MGMAPAGGQIAPTAGFNVNQAAAGGLQKAMQGTQAAMGYRPVSVQPGQIAGANLGAYTNPYESQVVQQSLQDIGGAQQQAMNQLGAQATAARAFGGSRHGIAEAETNRNFIDQAARMASGLRQQGYQTAQQLAGQDIATNMQAQLANQAAQMQANQQRMAAASQMGGLGQQAFQTGQAINQQQMQQGGMQQALQQALIDTSRRQYAGFTGAPAASLSAPLAALGAAPYGQTTTQTQQPGLFQWLTPFLGVL
ncbi:MAG: hypothetical protein EBT13_14810 [Rhodobacteraceae bacterium]|nr:hypothetical protein [Paracoccaceae bacterium]